MVGRRERKLILEFHCKVVVLVEMILDFCEPCVVSGDLLWRTGETVHGQAVKYAPQWPLLIVRRTPQYVVCFHLFYPRPMAMRHRWKIRFDHAEHIALDAGIKGGKPLLYIWRRLEVPKPISRAFVDGLFEFPSHRRHARTDRILNSLRSHGVVVTG